MINSIVVVNGNYGSIDLRFDDGTKMSITLSEEEARMIQVVGEQLYEARRTKLTENMARPLPALADFSEVPAASDDLFFNH